MRSERTFWETRALDSLKSSLQAGGDVVHEIENITDRPDAALDVSGEVIAVECRVVSIERLLELHKLKLPLNEPCEVFFPVEPHIWVESAIVAKEPKVEEYKRNAGAEKAWLVLHSHGQTDPTDVMTLYNTNFKDLFHAACCRTPHSFDRIYLAGQGGEHAICIFDRTMAEAEKKQYARLRPTGILIKRTSWAHAIAEDMGNGEAGFSGLHAWKEGQKRFTIQPLDPYTKIDYKSILELTAAESFQFAPEWISTPTAKRATIDEPFVIGVWLTYPEEPA
jgi:hypothetical protein